MLHATRSIAARKRRRHAQDSDGASWVSEADLRLALRAAGVSAEDVERLFLGGGMDAADDLPYAHPLAA